MLKKVTLLQAGFVVLLVIGIVNSLYAQGGVQITSLRPAAVAKIMDEFMADIATESEDFDKLSTRLSDSIQHLKNVPRSAQLIDTIVSHGKIVKAHIQARMIYIDTVIAQLKAKTGYTPAEELSLAIEFFSYNRELLRSSSEMIDIVVQMDEILHRMYLARTPSQARKMEAQINTLNNKIDIASKKQGKQAAHLQKTYSKLLGYLQQ